MENLERCPACHLAPSVTIEETPKFNITLTCEQHGYMAMGDTVENAKANWNLFVGFCAKAA